MTTETMTVDRLAEAERARADAERARAEAQETHSILCQRLAQERAPYETQLAKAAEAGQRVADLREEEAQLPAKLVAGTEPEEVSTRLATLHSEIATAERMAENHKKAAALLMPGVEATARAVQASAEVLRRAQFVEAHVCPYEIAGVKAEAALRDAKDRIREFIEQGAQLEAAHQQTFGKASALDAASLRVARLLSKALDDMLGNVSGWARRSYPGQLDLSLTAGLDRLKRS